MKSFWIFVLLAVASAAVFFPAFQNGFTVDDGNAIADNRELDRPVAEWLFNSRYFEVSRELSYRPLVSITHVLDRRFGPKFGHGLNLALHILAGFGLFLLGQNFVGEKAGFIGSLLFLIHPAYSETVYVITFREDILCALLMIWTILALRSDRPIRAGIFFVLALLSKESAILMPVFIAVFAAVTSNTRASRAVTPLTLIAAVYIVVRFLLLPGPAWELSRHAPFFQELGWISWTYAKLAVWPDVLSVDHRLPAYLSFTDWIPGLIFFVSVVGLTAWGLARKSLAGLAGLWFILFLAPVLNLVPILHVSAERYLYIPMMAPALAAGALLARMGIRVAIGIIVALLAARTHDRGYEFRDMKTLYEKEYQVNPRSVTARAILGEIELMSGNRDRARLYFQRAMGIEPSYVPAYVQLGKIDFAEGRRKEAMMWFESARMVAPDGVEAVLCLAEAKRIEGDTLVAESLYRQGAAMTPRPWEMNQAFLESWKRVRERYRENQGVR